MKYNDARAFRTALEARLKQSGSDGTDLTRRRRTVAFDRLLARLAVADHRAWLLKGGAALEFRLDERARATKDIDLALLQNEDPVDVLLDDLEPDVFGDYFEFQITRRKELQAQDDRGPVVRLSVQAQLDGRPFESFVIDVVVPSTPPAAREHIEIGLRFEFAGLPTVDMPVIDLDTHWAEKFSAYVRRYDGRPNTRVKDLVDLVLLIDFGLEPSSDLAAAIETTFAARSQQLPNAEVPSMATEWAEPFAEMATELQVSTPDAHSAHALVEDFWRQCTAALN